MRSIDEEMKASIKQLVEIFFYISLFVFCSHCIAQTPTLGNRDSLGSAIGRQGVSPTITSFNGGQVGAGIETRPDFPNYSSSNRITENMLVTTQGPVQRRPGTRFVAQVATGEGIFLERPAVDGGKVSISTPQELQDIANDLSGDYQLINSIDMTGFTFEPLGNWSGSGPASAAGFTGTFDGRYYEISNLTMIGVTGGIAMGLFGATHDAIIENLIVKDFNYRFSRNIGGLIGYMDISTVCTDVAVNGDIQTVIPTGSLSTGGFFGRANGESAVTRCSAIVDINVTNRSSNTIVAIGGFSGTTGLASYTDCYSQGEITGASVLYELRDAGAFTSGASKITDFETIFTRCYTATQYDSIFAPFTRVGGFIGNLSGTDETIFFDNHWDQTLNPTLEDIGDPAPLDRSGIDAETTTAMQQQATYTNWDFTLVTGVWAINEGVDYPTHIWHDEATKLNTPWQSGNSIVRLIPFEVSTNDSYVLEFGNQYIRFYRDDGT